MIDIPEGYAAVIVAIIGAVAAVIGVWWGRRSSRITALERENRQLWFALRGVVDLLYREGLTIPDYLSKVINTEEDS